MDHTITTHNALEHFKAADPTMASLLRVALAHHTPIALPTPKPQSQYFGSIVRSIVSQQISVKAADAIFARIVTRAGATQRSRRDAHGITPKRILALPEADLKGCGLSAQKTKYIRHNAAIWHTIDTRHFSTLSDEAVIGELTKLYGIGRWTAEMFLMFTLARPNVFSYGDLGLMQSLYQHYPVKPHHTRKIASLVDAWSPHKTLASLALWWHKDGGPVLL